MGQRTTLEEEMARHTTPMYRAPEMLDMWANYSIDTAADVWALGCTLFFLCFHQHPFEDSAKLAIVNGNYRIPAGDFTYKMFHDLIKQVTTKAPKYFFSPFFVQVVEIFFLHHVAVQPKNERSTKSYESRQNDAMGGREVGFEFKLFDFYVQDHPRVDLV